MTEHRNQYSCENIADSLYDYIMLRAVSNHLNYSNKLKMPKNTTACPITSFIPAENMNVEKFRFSKMNSNKFSQVCIKKIFLVSALLATTNTNSIFFAIIFAIL